MGMSLLNTEIAIYRADKILNQIESELVDTQEMFILKSSGVRFVAFVCFNLVIAEWPSNFRNRSPASLQTPTDSQPPSARKEANTSLILSRIHSSG